MLRAVRTRAAFTRGVPWTGPGIAWRLEELLARIPGEDRGELLAQARALSKDCGCAIGGASFCIALPLAAVYLATTPGMDLGHLTAGALFVLVMTVLGKLMGLFVAWARLLALYWSSSRRLRRGGGAHVNLH